MRTHTNAFKQKIASFGKQISGRLYHYFNYDLITEDGNTLITEDGIKLLSEQINPSDKELIDEELIYSISLVKNGQLLQSLMKELDFEAQYDLKIGETINAQFGVLVGNNFEYLDYGNYIVYSKEYIAENQTWKYVCYDKMLYSMKSFKRLNIEYPCTIRNYINAIAYKMGLTFSNLSETFVNYNENVLPQLFLNQNITYRDVLDKLSEITASNILINDNDELEIGYPSETNDTIDEENLKDININFNEIFGPINRAAIYDTKNKINYIFENDLRNSNEKITEISIYDNQFVNNENGSRICNNILNKLNGLTYSINDFSTTGVCYYDYLDLFNVSIGEDTYKCLLLNNEINITQGLEENIFTEKKSNSENENDIYENNNLSNKEIQQEIDTLNNDKTNNKSIIDSINSSQENIKINSAKFLIKKTITNTTDNNGFLNLELDGSNILIGATANFNSNNYGFLIPYYHYNNGKPIWYLKIQDKNNVALANTNIEVEIFYFKKPI